MMRQVWPKVMQNWRTRTNGAVHRVKSDLTPTQARQTDQQCAEKGGNRSQNSLSQVSFMNNGTRNRKWPTAMTSAVTQNTATAAAMATKVTSSAGFVRQFKDSKTIYHHPKPDLGIIVNYNQWWKRRMENSVINRITTRGRTC